MTITVSLSHNTPNQALVGAAEVNDNCVQWYSWDYIQPEWSECDEECGGLRRRGVGCVTSVAGGGGGGEAEVGQEYCWTWSKPATEEPVTYFIFTVYITAY